MKSEIPNVHSTTARGRKMLIRLADQAIDKKQSNLRAGYQSIPALKFPRTLKEMTEIAAEELGEGTESEAPAGE